LFLEDGDVAILIEAKTTLKIDDVREHIERLEKYRRYIDAGTSGEKRHFVGAVAGTVVAENVIRFAHENGLYVIVQTARDVEIVPLPEGFVATGCEDKREVKITYHSLQSDKNET